MKPPNPNPIAYPLTLHVQGHLTAVRLPKQVYTVLKDGQIWTYGSSAAMLADPANPLTIGRDRLAYLARSGWPIEADGCQVWRGPLLLHQPKKI